MNQKLCSSRQYVCWIIALGCCGAALTGCGNNGGNGGGDTGGQIAGQVVNDTTGAALAGVLVVLDPAVEGIEITTAADGTYTQALPIGVYTVTFNDQRFDAFSATVSINDGATTTLDASLAPIAPVVVTASMEGDAQPGATVTVSAAVEILDGTGTVQSYAWRQSNSVDVEIQNGTTAMASVTLPASAAFKAELVQVLREPPIDAEELPPNVPLPEGEFPGGLQDRFQVVGLNPFALEEAGLVTLEVDVTTTAGTFTDQVEVHTALPWRPAAGIHNVPIGVPVLLHGKTQDSYDWALTPPTGSTAALADATTQNPEFTPDLPGLYTVRVTDAGRAEQLTLEVYAGTWEGVITGQDADGRPVAANCTACHNGNIAEDVFTPWAQTGHAEILTDSLNTNDHYSIDCFSCHSVGFEPLAANGGFDDAADFMAFLDNGLIANPDPGNWTTMLSEHPASAQLANVQCENCHGPQNGMAHTMGDPRMSLSSDVCATCHGEPLRHARFQQWQLSAHANYELAIAEGEDGSCARCHTANGFLAWLPILLDDDPATDPLDNVEVTWTADQTHPQTCATCHDPHMIGTSSGDDTNATVRISGNTPPLIGGFQVFGAGRGAICMTCHNSRRGLRNDDNYEETAAAGDASRAPHGSAQTDILMGQNAYLVEVGIRGSHSLIEDTCVTCHMQETPPPAVLSYNLGGSNHTFYAGPQVCANCHDEVGAESVQTAFDASSGELLTLIEDALLRLISDLIAGGNTVDLNGEATIDDPGDIRSLAFGESGGRQAITVTLADDTVIGPLRVTDVDVVDGTGAIVGQLYDFADPRLAKAGWNWNFGNNDGSRGVHNPSFVFSFLDAASDALNDLAREQAEP